MTKSEISTRDDVAQLARSHAFPWIFIVFPKNHCFRNVRATERTTFFSAGSSKGLKSTDYSKSSKNIGNSGTFQVSEPISIFSHFLIKPRRVNQEAHKEKGCHYGK